MRVLTIIGNGFDLGHGLPTLFDQFIEYNPSVYKSKYGVFQNDCNSWNQIESKYEELLCEIMESRSWQDSGWMCIVRDPKGSGRFPCGLR